MGIFEYFFYVLKKNSILIQFCESQNLISQIKKKTFFRFISHIVFFLVCTSGRLKTKWDAIKTSAERQKEIEKKILIVLLRRLTSEHCLMFFYLLTNSRFCYMIVLKLLLYRCFEYATTTTTTTMALVVVKMWSTKAT